jgi:preprotein translocase subunit SecE
VKWWTRMVTFLVEARTELRKTTWPDWKEVRGTTVVVIVTSVIFAVFLWAVDLILQNVVTRLTQWFKA